ncbi:MAG: hypothetical protein MUO27_00155 [Sedimentisphaerales bacterium]|nr:hypothetical protein [Sedimentisphaerales bacterium]
MGKIESLILGMFFGIVPLAAFFMATVLFAAIVFGKETLGPWTLWSLLPGFLIDVLFLKRWVKNAYTMNAKAIGAVYVFYSVCALGFFMGIPIGNIFLGILAGIYSARRFSLTSHNRPNAGDYFKRTAIFSAAVMVLICALLALWAVAGKVPGSKFQTPFISFTFTAPIFWTVVIVGGAFLVLLQYGLTITIAKVVSKLSR